MNVIVDTHAHLTDDAFVDRLPAIIRDAVAAGVTKIGVIGFDRATSQRACEIATAYGDVCFASVGIQPTTAIEAADGDWEQIVALSSLPTVRALGETGLDNYWKETPRALQHDYFERHIELSKTRALPLVIHLRESGQEIVDQLKPHAAAGVIRGVMHSFTGDLAICKTCLEMGLYISFAGMITYKNAGELRTIAQYVPADRLLVETDSPYLSPEPMRGKRPNEPARVVHTLRAIASLRGVSESELASQTTLNAKNLFGI